ncbi:MULTISPECIES: hypothetical protein [Arthrobacter]|uniref:Uncharacterized protein n=1 Tax=Arthrobacter psychrochitiniphilus TaxID=291045 RepID=A0A2V3DU74_9MICC|nr:MULTISPECIES: hypothetical protein [Arthrobacter]NYG18801.1 hypothetical protein [Arthrobacter psychrochitiniphilus]PXA66282.1 hypothetical protein CVS29_06175 [Arthrobacter psychrochitiniphilus]
MATVGNAIPVAGADGSAKAGMNVDANVGRGAVAHRSGTKPAAGRKKTVGTAVAAVTLAAVTVLSGPALVGGSMAAFEPGSIIGSPPNSASSRIAGVHEDMARAVQLQQLTPEQAAFMESQLVKRIHGDA